MADAQGVSTQTLTDGRLTLKQAHLDYLDLPKEGAKLDITYGFGKCILLHNQSRREKLLDELLDSDDMDFDPAEQVVELHLDGVAQTVTVDDQGRLRVPELHLKFAELTDKSCKVVVIPQRRSRWLELWREDHFDAHVSAQSDEWQDVLSRVRKRRREEREGHSGS